jgi:hypothetical protein
LELLHRWDDPAARATATDAYQLARVAAEAGDHASALEHIEQAILAYPTYTAAATLDPAFDDMQASVQELVNRLTTPPSPGVRTAALTGTPDGAQPIELAQAYLDMARAHFELGTYAGYAMAAQTAMLAQQTAAGSRVARLSKRAAILNGAGERGLRPLGRALRRATRKLWDRLPLLAILLGWFLAGVLFGVASLPFQEAGIAEMRGIVFSIWALGLVGMVLAGFLRSIRRIVE